MKNVTPRQKKAMSLLRWTLPRAPKALALDGEGKLTAAAHEAVGRAFAETFARHRAVGGTVALVRRGVVLDAFAYGRARLAPDMPAAVDTIYRVASVSKLAFTFGVMALVENGTLALDADIGDVLGYPVRNPAHAGTPITLRQLLTHTAGLLDEPVYDGPGISGALTLRQMLSPPNAARTFARTAPGEAFRYSNFGAGIVGSLVEAATAERFDDVLQRTLFGPLGVEASFAPQRMLPHAARLACGYAVPRILWPLAPRLAYDAPAIAAAPLSPADPERDFSCAPGRMLISVPDMAQLIRLLCSDGTVDGARVLSPAGMAEMLTPQARRGSVTGDAGRGLNVAFCPDMMGRAWAVGHQGVAYGMNAELWADSDTGDGVAMATSGVPLFDTGKLVHCGWAVTRLGFDVLGALA